MEGWSIDSDFIKEFHDEGQYKLPIDKNVPIYIYDLLPFHGLQNFPKEMVKYGLLYRDIEAYLGEEGAVGNVLDAVEEASLKLPRSVYRAIEQVRAAITAILNDIFHAAEREAEQRGSDIVEIQDVRNAVRSLYPSFISGSRRG